ncbi:hypothetical protein PF049_14205 (plasmid) [Erythrobacteraceae bacterium WH01K]|nr:hypothetical protein PF049_14205 [Erythrobacteraceae bacterium WH01K]
MSDITINWHQGATSERAPECEAVAIEAAEKVFRRAQVTAGDAWAEYRRQSVIAMKNRVYTFTGLAAVWCEADLDAQESVQDLLWDASETPLISIASRA